MPMNLRHVRLSFKLRVAQRAVWLSFRAKMLAASRAAFLAPAVPIATVATGTPPGICTIESRAPSPPKEVAAIMPGKAALAPTIIISKPRPAAVLAHWNVKSGARWAEKMRISKGI